jgi:tetratricopeptide (TPR) repeat protein
MNSASPDDKKQWTYMDLKWKALELLECARKEEQAFVQRLSDKERFTIGTPEQWSAKDMIAHIAAWKERAVQELAIMASGEPGPDFGGYDQVNARIFKKHQGFAWSEVLNKSRQVHRLLQEQTEAMPNDVLTDARALDWHGEPIWRLIVVRGCTHPLHHLAQCYIDRGNVDYATRIQTEAASLLLQLDDDPVWQGYVHYGLANHYAGLGQTEKTINELREALRLNPDLIERSRENPRFASVQEDAEYRSLLNAE